MTNVSEMRSSKNSLGLNASSVVVDVYGNETELIYATTLAVYSKLFVRELFIANRFAFSGSSDVNDYALSVCVLLSQRDVLRRLNGLVHTS